MPQGLVYRSLVQVAAGVSSFLDCDYDPFSPPPLDEDLLGELLGDFTTVKPESPASPAEGCRSLVPYPRFSDPFSFSSGQFVSRAS